MWCLWLVIVWAPSIMPPAYNLTWCATCKSSGGLSNTGRWSATSTCRLPVSVSIQRVCSSPSCRLTPKWGILALWRRRYPRRTRRALCSPVVRPAEHTQLFARVIRGQWSFRDCWEAESTLVDSPGAQILTWDRQENLVKSSKLSSVSSLWNCAKDSLSLGSCATWFFSALWNWATVTTWLQQSIFALSEPAPWLPFWSAGLPILVWEGPKCSTSVLFYISLVIDSLFHTKSCVF